MTAVPSRFVHISFAFNGVPKMRDLEPAMTAVGDWVRYSQLCWIVWTDKPLAQIYLILQHHVDVDDQLLIADVDPRLMFGRLSPWIWQWVNSKGISQVQMPYARPLKPLLPKGGP
jgi:hypothetical protein